MPTIGRGRTAARLVGRIERLAHAAHVLDRHDDLQVELLARARVHDPHLAAGATKERGDGGKRPLRRRETDALRLLVCEAAQPFEAEGQVRAALGASQGMDLVDDHVLDAAQDLARLAGEQQVEALGRGDQDVRRVPDQLTSRVGGRVTGAAGHPDLGQRGAFAFGGAPDARQRRAQVALDVVGQRLQRRDVQDARAALLLPRRRRDEEAVEAPEEGGQGLAASRRSVEERVRAVGDGRPAEQLGTRRLGECLAEPVASRRRETDEGVEGTGTSHGIGQFIGLSGLERAFCCGRPAPRVPDGHFRQLPAGWVNGASSGCIPPASRTTYPPRE